MGDPRAEMRHVDAADPAVDQALEAQVPVRRRARSVPLSQVAEHIEGLVP